MFAQQLKACPFIPGMQWTYEGRGKPLRTARFAVTHPSRPAPRDPLSPENSSGTLRFIFLAWPAPPLTKPTDKKHFPPSTYTAELESLYLIKLDKKVATFFSPSCSGSLTA